MNLRKSLIDYRKYKRGFGSLNTERISNTLTDLKSHINNGDVKYLAIIIRKHVKTEHFWPEKLSIDVDIKQLNIYLDVQKKLLLQVDTQINKISGVMIFDISNIEIVLANSKGQVVGEWENLTSKDDLPKWMPGISEGNNMWSINFDMGKIENWQ
jgi:hypothetical protein